MANLEESRIFIEESTLSAIGDAIREKEGSTDLVPVTDMASRISAMTIGADNKLTYFVSSFANGCRQIVFPNDTELTVYLRDPSSIANAFLDARNLKYIKIYSENSLGNPDTEGSINMSAAFRDCEELEIVDLTDCRRKLSAVDFMIYSSPNIKQILGALDISSIASISAKRHPLLPRETFPRIRASR